jgi:hypothetical protein
MMKNRVRRFRFWLLATVLFASVATAQLNPTVKVSSTPAGAAPENCAVGLASQERPRVEVSQIPEPAKRVANLAPPSSSLRGLLHDAQSAAVRGDRAAFRSGLAHAKEMLATYPSGGERTSASDVVRVYDDLDRIWTYQLETSTGAFFDGSTVPAEIMRGYPGYERAIADQLFIDASGHRFYPTAETRDYLIRQASERLNNLGVSVPMRAARTPRVLPRTTSNEPPAKSASGEQTRRSQESRPATHVTTTERKTKVRSEQTRRSGESRPAAHATSTERKTKVTRAKHATRHQATRVAEAKVKPAEPRRSEAMTTTTSPAVTESKPAPSTTTIPALPPSTVAPEKAKLAEAPRPVAAPAIKANALPITGTRPAAPTATAATTNTAAPAAVSPTSPRITETTASSPSTQSTETAAAPSSNDTTGSNATPQPQGKGVILPIILIVVGVGVLIVLFRASS